MMHPNHAALNCCILLAAAQYLFCLTGRRWLLLIAVLAMVMLFLTKSRTALMVGVACTAAFWCLAAPPSRLGWTLLLAAWAAAGELWLSSLGMLPNIAGMASMGREDVKTQDVSQLTGRTDIWKFAIMQADKDPNRTFIGYGYESFWTPKTRAASAISVKFKISEGHCVYLDWYLELGLVGISLYVLILLTAVLRWSITAHMLAALRRRSRRPSCAARSSTVLPKAASATPPPATLFVYASIAGGIASAR